MIKDPSNFSNHPSESHSDHGFSPLKMAVLIFLITLISGTSAYGRNFFVDDISRELKQAVARPLPKSVEILGESITTNAAPILVIGHLQNFNNKDSSDWGKAIGWYLAENTNGISSQLATVASYQYDSDGRELEDKHTSDRENHLLRVAQRTGAQYGITGSVIIGTRSTFELELKLFEYPDLRLIKSIQKNGQLDKIHMAVQEASSKLLETILIKINSHNTIKLPSILSPKPGELDALASAFSQEIGMSPEERVEFYSTLWRDNPSFSSLSTLYLLVLSQSGSNDQINQALPLLTAIEAPTDTFDIYRNLLNSLYSTNGIDLESIANLKEIIVKNPNLIVAWLALNHAYSNETVMYASGADGMTYVISDAIDHHLGYASAISISMAAVRRWPDYYRTWWGLSSNLTSYASLVRGTKYWRDIPKETQQRYKKLMALADQCLHQAIKRHPAQASLYQIKIGLDINQGRDWRESFLKAAELRPHDVDLYITAFNYSRPQWGGTKQDMRDVYELAKKNNPDAKWPQNLRDQWAPEIKPLVDLSSTKTQLLIAVALLGIFWLVKKVNLN